MPKADNLNLIPGMYVKIEGKTDVTKLSSDLHICTVAHMHPSLILNTHTHETNKYLLYKKKLIWHGSICF